MPTNFYTYLHCGPDGAPFYVGKGCRGRSHDLRRNRNLGHVATVAKHGADNVLVYVFDCDSEEQALRDEIQQIAQLRADGYALVNVLDGGENSKPSEMTKARISVATKVAMGRPEVRARLSALKMGGRQTPEHSRKISVALTGLKRSPETRARMSAAKKRYWQSYRGEVPI